ncbi:hypothetical protein AVEN_55265-1 [Araneus ventricosus]|uniref:Uncharacterized protein n=1 Tax=Araneus ventricosus TaxID=182803 RepID=A0A4Y2D843_ARAVE|nr:hypothetical protein AVEN_55265-1 [Araneus ventricosus]
MENGVLRHCDAFLGDGILGGARGANLSLLFWTCLCVFVALPPDPARVTGGVGFVTAGVKSPLDAFHAEARFRKHERSLLTSFWIERLWSYREKGHGKLEGE